MNKNSRSCSTGTSQFELIGELIPKQAKQAMKDFKDAKEEYAGIHRVVPQIRKKQLHVNKHIS